MGVAVLYLHSAALKFQMPQMGSYVEQTVFLKNQTWFVTKDDNWATRIGIYGNSVGDSLTDFAAERCESFFMGAEVGTLSSVAAMIFISLLKSALGGCAPLLVRLGIDPGHPHISPNQALKRGYTWP